MREKIPSDMNFGQGLDCTGRVAPKKAQKLGRYGRVSVSGGITTLDGLSL
jgi:hypothetical protein